VKYVEGVLPGEDEQADLVNLIAASVNNQPRTATKIIRSGRLDWEMIAANAICILSILVKRSPSLGDKMTDGVLRDLERMKAAA
jgi:hypothetical protein